MPPHGAPRDVVAYLGGQVEGWCAVTNPRLGIGAGLRWDVADFPFVWLWQELRSTTDYPWFGRGWVTALEPCTSFPNTGLDGVRRTTATQRVLTAGESRAFEVRAVLYEATGRVRRIDEAGGVELA